MIISILFTFLMSCGSSHSGPNDWKEYGLKGEVKELVSKRYFNAEKIDGKWDYSKGELYATMTYEFNRDGNIERMNSIYYLDSETFETEITFTFTDGRKTGSITKNKGETEAIETTIEWEGDHKYTWEPHSQDYNTIIVSELNEDYRDWHGSYETYVDGELVSSESYTNYFNDEGQILKSSTTNGMDGTSYAQLYKDVIYDSMGNIQEVALVDSASGELQVYTVKEITYY